MTPEELFDRAAEIARAVHASNTAEEYSRLCPKLLRHMHETLVMAAAAGVADTGQAYGNLFSQVGYLCKRHEVAIGNVVDIQAMRRHSNRSEPIAPEHLLYDVRSLCIFISAVFSCPVPASVIGLVPQTTQEKLSRREEAKRERYPYVRCIVDAVADTSFTATADNIGNAAGMMVDISAEHLRYLRPILRPGMQVNLIDSRSSRTDSDDIHYLQPSVVVIEPDFLIDISVIASCFKNYGRSPLNYIVKRFGAPANTQPILLGNLASAVLDDAVNAPETSINDTRRHNFRDKALAFSTCENFSPDTFVGDAHRLAANIKAAIEVMKHDEVAPLNIDKVLIEPSFVCEQLGISGRVDLMSADMSVLVEQKSGKNRNIEAHRSGRHGVQLEENYVQMLLYYGVLKYNFQLSGDKINMHLLYSKYAPKDGLVSMSFYQGLFREAIKMRNRMVALDMLVAERGFATIMPLLKPEVLNENRCADNLYLRYQLPQLRAMLDPLHALSETEHDYFCRMMTFLFREQRVARLGLQEGIGASAADLWNMPIAEKRETGNIYTDLKITAKERSEPYRGFDIVTLAVPNQGDDFLPNFRKGDAVFLYEYEDVPDVRRAVLYKGYIKDLSVGEITVALADGQQNKAVLVPQSEACYAVEHSSGDLSQGNKIHALHSFITAPKPFRDLLLAQREPTAGDCGDNDDVIARALSAQDYFLLVGPPGTGKTSKALRSLVERELNEAEDRSLLLLAYTNRAVDEICSMLTDAETDYLRIGSPYRCDPRFHDRLFANAVSERATLAEMRQLLSGTRVIVGTTTTIAAHEELFSLKRFSLAIVDEASQILEPDIIGLLGRHDGNGRMGVGRFILIGDHKQLPAVVQQSMADSRVGEESLRNACLDDCRNSLFERLLRIERRAGRERFIGILNRQGRMHPDIARFPCSMFYAKENISAVPLEHQLEPSEACRRVIFIPSEDCREPGRSDKVNTSEARIVVGELKRIYDEHREDFNPQQTVGVIVPYRNQIAVIRRETERLGIELLNNISIDTVERYQGSQRDVIIYSFTIQNPYQLDFLTANCFEEDGVTIDRKLNVVLTRARKQLIITGNRRTISRNDIFRKLIESVEDAG
ncbi:MAG: DEAD/DEAH box helicase [Prevotella sp.]|uniref:DEAD/DEAH box helicase n=1 Tax=Prevotella sp. TaxID=59823 RepID=UPI002A2B9DF8|nr:DEAD/DEAH box helicase [Prevotella sp.]MDD7317764.1 DEAD/DEAH box helicase [Prevotellaceae bacterium]MDY4020679.1 DEAD/DEAH box helicase [Prevotella sp.]